MQGDLDTESVEVLRERLNTMKRLMAERDNQRNNSNYQNAVWGDSRPSHSVGIINGNFLSIAFGGALLTIISVSIYAFYHLYHAVLKKFPSKHEEL